MLESKFLAKRIYYVLVFFKVVCVCVCMCVCVCVCVWWERERGMEGGREKETEILTDIFYFLWPLDCWQFKFGEMLYNKYIQFM